jgi:hypothetical protein
LTRSFTFLLLLAAGVAGLRLGSEGLHHYTDHWVRAAGPRESIAALAGPRAEAVRARNLRLVYPYSVIPGGVGSVAELRDAAAHDTVVAEHYAGFDYARARVIRVDRPRLVYLSYRRGGKIHWSSKQASLHPGEKLITDGKVTARERCGNQVSVLPQANTAPDEPLMAELDQPDALASGIEVPSTLNSQLMHMDPVMPVGPNLPGAGGGTPIGGTPVGAGPPGVSMPFPIGLPISGGTCVPSKKNHNCKQEPPPAAAPEPGTLVLMFSGGAAVLVRFRRKRR